VTARTARGRGLGRLLLGEVELRCAGRVHGAAEHPVACGTDRGLWRTERGHRLRELLERADEQPALGPLLLDPSCQQLVRVGDTRQHVTDLVFVRLVLGARRVQARDEIVHLLVKIEVLAEASLGYRDRVDDRRAQLVACSGHLVVERLQQLGSRTASPRHSHVPSIAPAPARRAARYTALRANGTHICALMLSR
jgi:hypothetical protein